MSISVESILDDLENDRLPLPTLPEVALKVRETADNEDASISDVARIIETDAALSARIIQVGNSSLYKGMNQVETVQAAAMRMGLNTVRNLATSLVMKQLFKAKHPVVDEYLRKAWKQSTDVAAFSSIIARNSSLLQTDSALLAGLTHSIGLSPILVKMESHPEMLANPRKLEHFLYKLYPRIGSKILEKWGFTDAISKVPAEHLNIDREGNNGLPDYVDVVQVALCQTVNESHHPLYGLNPEEVSSFSRLQMLDGPEEIEMSGGVEEMEEIRRAIA